MTRSLNRIEEAIQRSIVELWLSTGRDDVQMIHIPNQWADTRAKRGIGKALGCWFGAPDLMFIPRAGSLTLFMEVKRPGGHAQENQIAAQDRIVDLGHRYALVRSLDEAARALSIGGYLKHEARVG